MVPCCSRTLLWCCIVVASLIHVQGQNGGAALSGRVSHASNDDPTEGHRSTARRAVVRRPTRQPIKLPTGPKEPVKRTPTKRPVARAPVKPPAAPTPVARIPVQPPVKTPTKTPVNARQKPTKAPVARRPTKAPVRPSDRPSLAKVRKVPKPQPTPRPITPAPAPISLAPRTLAPATAAPRTAAPVTAAPRTATPVTVTAAPRTAAPVAPQTLAPAATASPSAAPSQAVCLSCTPSNACFSTSCKVTGRCVYTPIKTCPTGQSCQPATGNCLSQNDLRPCVGVIDESSQFNNFITSKWNTFRVTYPQRPFCLLQPAQQDYNNTPFYGVYLPPAFLNDTNVLRFNITREDSTVPIIPKPPLADWFDLCDIDVFAATGLSFVGLYIDTSGSMTAATVRNMTATFIQKLNQSGLAYKTLFNDLEDWITPFLTDLSTL